MALSQSAEQKKQMEALRAKRAALRPKISAEEARHRRAASLKRFKIYEYSSFAVLIVVLIAIQSRMGAAALPDAPNESLLNHMLVYFGAIMVYVGLMLRQGFLRVSRDDETISEDKSDHPFRGWFLTWILPIVAILILIPSLSAGVFNDDDMNAWGAVGIFVFMLVIAYLLSALFAAFVIFPIELIIRGLVALVTGDKKNAWVTIVGLSIAGITAFIFIGAAAVEAELPYPAGSFQVLSALLGVPGGYEVQSEPLLWVARGIALFYVILFFMIRRAGKNDQQKTTR